MKHKWALMILVDVNEPTMIKDLGGMKVSLPNVLDEKDVRCKQCGRSYPDRQAPCE